MATDNNEYLDLFEIWGAIWQKKLMIVIFALVFGLLLTASSYLLPDIYRSDVLLAPALPESRDRDLASFQRGLRGYATIAGLSAPQKYTVNEHIAVLRSRQFLWRFIDDENLVPDLFADLWDSDRQAWKEASSAPSRWDAYYLISRDVLEVTYDADTGLVLLAVEWTDPDQSANWANALVDTLNSYQRQRAIEQSERNLQYLQRELERTQVAEIRQTIFLLIGEEQKTAMLANAQQEFAFRVLDTAAVPERRVRPKRLLIALLTTVMGGLLAVVYVVGTFAYRRGLQRRER